MQLIPGRSKRSRCEARKTVIRVRGVVFRQTRTSTVNEHGNHDGAFFNCFCSPFFIFSVPVVLPHQTLLMTQALRTSAATMFRR